MLHALEARTEEVVPFEGSEGARARPLRHGSLMGAREEVTRSARCPSARANEGWWRSSSRNSTTWTTRSRKIDGYIISIAVATPATTAKKRDGCAFDQVAARPGQRDWTAWDGPARSSGHSARPGARASSRQRSSAVPQAARSRGGDRTPHASALSGPPGARHDSERTPRAQAWKAGTASRDGAGDCEARGRSARVTGGGERARAAATGRRPPRMSQLLIKTSAYVAPQRRTAQFG